MVTVPQHFDVAAYAISALDPAEMADFEVHLATCDRIRDVAHKHGIKCAMHCASAAFAAGALKRGFDMIMLTSDVACLTADDDRVAASVRQRVGDGALGIEAFAALVERGDC